MLSGLFSGLFCGSKPIKPNKSDLTDWEVQEINNKNYEPINFEEENIDEDDFYSDDLVSEIRSINIITYFWCKTSYP